jgi:hypothetical protein
MNDATLAETLGVSRDRLRDVRAGLVEGTHWRKAGRAVVWTPEGFAAARVAVLEAVGVEVGAGVEADDGTNGTEGTDGAYIEIGMLRVVRRVINPHIVLASRMEDVVDGRAAVPQRVRVRSSENFIPGMVLRARRVDGDLWELCGRCPRWRGRW